MNRLFMCVIAVVVNLDSIFVLHFCLVRWGSQATILLLCTHIDIYENYVWKYESSEHRRNHKEDIISSYNLGLSAYSVYFY